MLGLSARIFGVNSWAVLAPQALMVAGSAAWGCVLLGRADWLPGAS